MLKECVCVCMLIECGNEGTSMFCEMSHACVHTCVCKSAGEKVSVCVCVCV